VLILVAFVLVLGGLAAGTAFYVYDRATAIDRSTPQVVGVQFLDAALKLKDPKRVGLFICSSWTADQAMTAAAFPPAAGDITANWNDFVTTIDGRDATIIADVQFVGLSGETRIRLSQVWTLHLEQEDGWRVCSLDRSNSLEP
jgi:hypothetical protein